MLKGLLFPIPDKLYLIVPGFLTEGILKQENVQLNSKSAL